MRLTRILASLKTNKRVIQPYTGKWKIVPSVEVYHKKRAVANLLRNAKNIELLDKPYLAPEEEFGSVKAMKAEGMREDFLEKVKKEREENWLQKRPHYTIESHLEQLEISKKWE